MRGEMRDALKNPILDEAVELARGLWHAYLIEPTEEGGRFIFESLHQENFSLIGTGKHELYANLSAFVAGLERDQQEAQNITFEILDDYYEARLIGGDVCLVFGTLWVRERAHEPKPLLVEMDTRFSMLLKRVDDRWMLAHLHHSTPNADQHCDEYYPKTVTEQVNAALAYTKTLERRAELDSVTSLLNRGAFEKHVSAAMARSDVGGVFFMIDLDDFKQVNDTLGHPEGDRVIVEFADVLGKVFACDALIGRMGGDEFAVFAECPFSAGEAEAKARELIDQWSARSSVHSVKLGCSIGLAIAKRGQGFFDLYRAADKALYATKRNGKGCTGW